jgi:hypothetical protein
VGFIKQFRSQESSLWQSAVDFAVYADAAEAAGVAAPLLERQTQHPLLKTATAFLEKTQAMARILWRPPGTGLPLPEILDSEMRCAALAFKAGGLRHRGETTMDPELMAESDRLIGELVKGCDPRWAKAAITFGQFLSASRRGVPYRRHMHLSDFVVEDRLPDTARIALVGDWATGESDAKAILENMSRKRPDAVIHLGDIYYSGVQHEIEAFFWRFVTRILDLRRTSVFTLAGNHEVYSGGEAYYRLLDQLGQPASYFCLRNQNWQFLAMDTGLHSVGDNSPGIEPSELDWLEDKVTRRAAETRWSRRFRLNSEQRIPLPKRSFEFVIQDFSPGLD